MTSDRQSLPEFVAMCAILVATVAFSIDAMLPALPDIATELSPELRNRAQLIITAFVLGMGLGTCFVGPISDTIGRNLTITVCAAIYIAASFVAMRAENLEVLLAARVVQGLGAAGPRVVTMAMIRDLYDGRRMAQVVSFVMTVFVLVPAFAPSIGAAIIAVTGTWRAVFGAFMIFGLLAVLWLNLRRSETLGPDARRKFELGALGDAAREVLTHRMVQIYIAALTVGFALLFALLSSIQQIYAQIFDQGHNFHFWFMATGLLSAGGTILNAALVMRFGMRRLAMAAFGGQAVFSALLLAAFWASAIPDWAGLPAFFVWSTSVFFMVGLTFGNLNALALQPMGHIAGMAASLVGGVSTILAVPIAVPIGLAFNGTPMPVLAGSVACTTVAFLLMRKSREMDPTPHTTVRKPH